MVDWSKWEDQGIMEKDSFAQLIYDMNTLHKEIPFCQAERTFAEKSGKHSTFELLALVFMESSF